MWRGCEYRLMMYGLAICDEWISRGYEDNMRPRILDLAEDALRMRVWPPTCAHEPWWLGEPGFHLSHQSNLIRKDPEHYQKYWPNVPPGLPYIWPSSRRG